MGIAFKGSDIIDIAVHIEKSGVDFYMNALSLVKEPSLTDCFTRLAAMEREHIVVFQELIDLCREKTKRDNPEDPAVSYLKAFARGHVFDPAREGSAALEGLRTPEDVLKRAIVAKKDAIALYTGIKAFIADDTCGREKIDRVLADEMNHLAELSECLETLAGTNE
jgi:rubrerythrin